MLFFPVFSSQIQFFVDVVLTVEPQQIKTLQTFKVIESCEMQIVSPFRSQRYLFLDLLLPDEPRHRKIL